MNQKASTAVASLRGVPWIRLIIGIFMIIEGATLEWGTSPQAELIGSGWDWFALFVIGGLFLIATCFMRPSRTRAFMGAVPIVVQLARAYASFQATDTLVGGGVITRVSLALLLANSVGWSADAPLKIRRRLNDMA